MKSFTHTSWQKIQTKYPYEDVLMVAKLFSKTERKIITPIHIHFLKNIIKKLVWHSCLIFTCICHPLSVAMSSTQLRCQRGFLNINLFAASLFKVLLKVILVSRHLLIAKQATAVTRLLSRFLTLKAILSVIRGTHSVMLITMTDRMASHSCPADKQQDWSIIAHESGGVHPLRQG